MKLRVIAFTRRGAELGRRLLSVLPGELAEGFGPGKVDREAWTAESFRSADALLFIGAAGIAVRSIAPFVARKTEDPAVLVMDEQGRHVIPVLSGHIGGGNRLALSIADAVGASPVITTATDLSGLFAVDVWAVEQGLAIENPEAIKSVSSKLLRGERVRLKSEFPVSGAAPEGVDVTEDGPADIVISLHSGAEGLRLTPRCLTLGAGCRRGISADAVEAAFAALTSREGISPSAAERVRSIDLKAREAGLLKFCALRGLPFETASADALAAVPGTFSESAFVARTVGVGNVCERAAVLGGETLLIPKYAQDGVTLALGLREPRLTF